MQNVTAQQVVDFWREAGREKWFNGGAAFDAECREKFEAVHLAAARGELESWLENAESALAVLILLDQMPRNIWRGSGHAFAADGLARQYALRAIKAGLDAQVDADLRGFFYLPLEHSEAIDDQKKSVELFAALGNPVMHDYAIKHLEVIERFGRFPHRNAALGRESSAEELAWLAAGGGF
ncbi:hypothetical protein CO614_04110 [Lysobacteraceae bacterium NML120232]|nr:hypothetical protein CO614_04110 [Xanthomonadaceae bacterium NML120232]